MKKDYYKLFSHPKFLLLLFFTILIIDRGGKLYAAHNISPISMHLGYPFGGIAVFQDFFGLSFSLNYITNTGAAWGAFSSHPYFLTILRIGLILFLLVSLFRCPSMQKIPFVLILSGAIANLFDALMYGFVIDIFYFRFHEWSFPLFNVADTSITIGILWLIFQYLHKKKHTKKESKI